MSQIDFSNPRVLTNYLTARAEEGKGKFFIKKEVVCFKDEGGMEFVIPDNLQEKYLEKYFKAEEVKEVKEETPSLDLVELRARYQEVHGKRPFNGWTAEQILEKL